MDAWLLAALDWVRATGDWFEELDAVALPLVEKIELPVTLMGVDQTGGVPMSTREAVEEIVEFYAEQIINELLRDPPTMETVEQLRKEAVAQLITMSVAIADGDMPRDIDKQVARVCARVIALGRLYSQHYETTMATLITPVFR